jgi:hypothetical protein
VIQIKVVLTNVGVALGVTGVNVGVPGAGPGVPGVIQMREENPLRSQGVRKIGAAVQTVIPHPIPVDDEEVLSLVSPGGAGSQGDYQQTKGY